MVQLVQGSSSPANRGPTLLLHQARQATLNLELRGRWQSCPTSTPKTAESVDLPTAYDHLNLLCPQRRTVSQHYTDYYN